jgi:hypothetical protein
MMYNSPYSVHSTKDGYSSDAVIIFFARVQ